MGSNVNWSDAPAEYAEQVKELRTKIIEAAAEFDDEVAEKFLNEQAISNEEIKAAIPQRCYCPKSCSCVLRYCIQE